MPENNPFEILPETKPNNTLSAREKLFADMGLSPQGRPLEPILDDTDFLNADFKTDDDFISLTDTTTSQPIEIETVADEDMVVDAIFPSTDPETTSSQELVLEPEQTTHDFDIDNLTAVFPNVSKQVVTNKDELALPKKPLELEVNSNELVTELALQEEQAPLTNTAVPEPETMSVLKSLDRAGFDPIVDAYTDLQQKLAANQALINAEREAIAALRHQMRQLNAHGSDMSETRVGLDQGRQLVQADSCENLIRSIGQVNELIQQDSQGAVQLMTSIKAGVEVLELRVKHVNAIENLLAHMQEGLKLQEQLAGADTLIHNLAKQLGLNFA